MIIYFNDIKTRFRIFCYSVLVAAFFITEMEWQWCENILMNLSIDSIFINNIITIACSIGGVIFTIIAILSALSNYRIDENANIIKNYLETFSNYYNKCNVSNRCLEEKIYDIEVFLEQYKRYYEDFYFKNDKIKKIGNTYLRLSDIAFFCFFIAIFFNYIYLYLIYYKSFFLFLVAAAVICIGSSIFWIYYFRNILFEYLVPAKYNIDFPSYENLITPNESIFVSGRKVVTNLPTYIFANSSYIVLKRNQLEESSMVILHTLGCFKINASIEVTYNNTKNGSYYFTSSDLSQDINNAIYVFEPKGNISEISKIEIFMKTEIESREWILNFQFFRTDSNDRLICKNIIGVNSGYEVIKNYNIIKPTD